MFLRRGLLFFAILGLLICTGKATAGSNANAVLSLDWIDDGGAGNQIDDGVTSGTVSGQGTKIEVEVLATGVTTPLLGVRIEFDFDASILTYVGAWNSAFPLILSHDATGTVFGIIANSPASLSESGFLARAKFTTAVDVTDREFSIGIKQVLLYESQSSSDSLTTTDVIRFNASSSPEASRSPDFDGDDVVGIPDFLQFVDRFGTMRGDGKYEAKYDLDGDGVVGIPDFLIFVDNFGKEVPAAVVSIPDANLRAAIEAALSKASGSPITEAEMLTLTELSVPGADIRDLTGLEFAAYLTYLDTRYNYGIRDISSLSGLTDLKTFYLGCNRFTDISPLSGLTNLTDLNIGGNGFTDISSLAGLTKLTRLHLGNNDITDISSLSGLVNLTELGLGGNDLTDISPLAGLTNLNYLLLLTNDLTDISPLAGLINLDYLDLRHNNITDISPLSGLTNLGSLYISDNAIRDTLPLSGLTTNLFYLDLDENDIRDISPLTGLSRVGVLNLGGNNITDIPSLSGLTRLNFLRLGFNNIRDISSLSGLTRRIDLDLKFNNITDISPLSGLTRLRSLDLRGNPLNDSSINDHITVLESGGVRVLFDLLRKGDFDIELVFLDQVTEFQKNVIQYTARRWMSVIVEDLPDYIFTQGFSGTCGGQSYEIPSGEQIDDLRIYVSTSVSSTFAIGRGGPQMLRETTHLPVVGCMAIKVNLTSRLLNTPLHEIGHVLGFGTLWGKFGFIQDLSWSDSSADTHFNGPRAIAAFDDAGGGNYGGKKVPVQKRDGGHWRFIALHNEIMLPARSGEGVLSAITVQSLADLGYGVDVTQADPYTVHRTAASGKIALGGSAIPNVDVEPNLECGVDRMTEPIYVVDQQGRIIRTIDNQ